MSARLPELGAVKTTQTRRGPLAYFDFDGVIGRALELYGEWAENELGFLRQFVEPGTTVVDAGANIGTHTIAFSEFVGYGEVVSVEGSIEISHLLRHNIETNGLSNVRLIRSAVGDAEGSVFFPPLDPSEMRNVGGTLPQDSGLQVHLVTLDSLALRDVSLVKLDVEGAELNVLRGATTLIAESEPAVFCEMLDIDSALRIVEFMRAFRYKSYMASVAAYNPDNFRGTDENSFGHTREAGLLLLPEARPVPRQTAGVELHAVGAAGALARLFLEMPRYGDLTEHDRKPDRLVAERNGLRSEVDRLLARETTLERALASATDRVRALESDLEERRREVERVAAALDLMAGVAAARLEQLSAFRDLPLPAAEERE